MPTIPDNTSFKTPVGLIDSIAAPMYCRSGRINVGLEVFGVLNCHMDVSVTITNAT